MAKYFINIIMQNQYEINTEGKIVGIVVEVDRFRL